MSAGATNEQAVVEAYVAALSRPPTTEEKDKLLATLNEANGDSRRQALEDFYWSLLSSREFQLNH